MMAQKVLRSTSRSTSQTALMVALPILNVRYRFRLRMKLLLSLGWPSATALFNVSITMSLLSQICGFFLHRSFLEEGPHDGQITELGCDERRDGPPQHNK